MIVTLAQQEGCILTLISLREFSMMDEGLEGLLEK
jgi:hypothetical protein